ncbi:MAG: hypothetical protein ACXVHY_09035 [Methanobacterium sp.]
MKKAYIRCKSCNGYYKLKEGESLEDFLTCSCGGKLEYSDKTSNKNKESIKEKNESETIQSEKNMGLKTTVPILIAFILISGFTVIEITNGNAENYLFNLIPYYYSSHVWMPPNTNNASLAGYYTIYGLGKVFNFHLVLPGAENTNDPLEYTAEGLYGTGTINNIYVTRKTINDLLSMKFKNAMFNTVFDGSYNMYCAAWKGNGTFFNHGENIEGTFQIFGPISYWEGNFTMKSLGNRIAVDSEYIWYDWVTPDRINLVNKTTYM